LATPVHNTSSPFSSPSTMRPAPASRLLVATFQSAWVLTTMGWFLTRRALNVHGTNHTPPIENPRELSPLLVGVDFLQSGVIKQAQCIEHSQSAGFRSWRVRIFSFRDPPPFFLFPSEQALAPLPFAF